MNLTQRKQLLASFQPIVDSLNDSFKTQKSVIEDQIKSIDKLIASNKKMAKSATTLVESHAKTEKAARVSIETQKKLGVVLDKETGKLFNKAGLRVDEFGRAVTKTDEKMGDFNKRATSIIWQGPRRESLLKLLDFLITILRKLKLDHNA